MWKRRSQQLSNADADPKGQQVYKELSAEFAVETERQDGAANIGASVDSIYARTTEIAGSPLRDGYHFGQTLINDFGRPYGEGFNSVAGITAHAEFGPFALYIRGEYQHAAAVASDSAEVLQATASADLLCVEPNAGPGCATVPVSELNDAAAQVNRFRLLDSAIVLNIHDVQVSFGKQSEWLGPSETGPLLLSNNAGSIPMLRIDNVSPFHFPLLSRLFGPARMDFFVGRLSGQSWDFNPPNLLGPNFNPQPFIHENKISFKPTENLEFGMGVTAMFGGPGLPFTWNEFVRSYYVHRNSVQEGNPAKRFSALDISYRVPHLRNWLTIYNDSLVGDQYSPLDSTRPVLSPGIYLPQLRKLPKMDLRVEILKEPFHGKTLNEFPPGFLYYDLRYRSGYTNDGNLLGSWIGRAGYGGQAWATYWFSPRNKLQIKYRHQQVNSQFVVNPQGQGGGHASDFVVQCDFRMRPDVALTAFLQYEQWYFPVLRPTPQSDVTASVQFTFYPKLQMHK